MNVEYYIAGLVSMVLGHLEEGKNWSTVWYLSALCWVIIALVDGLFL